MVWPLFKTYKRVIGAKLRSSLSMLIGRKMARARLRAEYYEAFRKHHPRMRYDLHWRENSLRTVDNESGMIFSGVVSILTNIGNAAGTHVLLAGESPQAKMPYSKLLSLSADAITTTGLHEGADVHWNFEEPPPNMGSYGIIVSHEILEHLIAPYQHVCDLIRLLMPGGYLVMSTVIPGFPYHRYPVDCLRFFPDWFVEVANRNQVEIYDQYLGEDHIAYTFRKPV